MPEEVNIEDAVEDNSDESSDDTGTDNKGSSSVPLNRFNAIYGKSKELERKLDESLKVSASMRDHNAELASRLDKLSLDVEKTSEKKVDTSISSLQKDRYEAIDEGDYARAAQLDEDIAAKREGKMRASIQKDMEKMSSSIRETEEQRSEREAIDIFSQQNPWFNENSENYNKDMAAYAVGVDTRLGNKNPNMPMKDRLRRVSEDTNTFFSSKLNPGGDPYQPGGVEGGGGAYPSKTNKPKLNDEQKRIAYAFFPEKTTKEAEDRYIKQMTFKE